ncbi:AgmX/PglI C-terminal domain-containing protein [Myxococcus sp. K15C18031901]|uniref:AgmX/PglI C-terminal domain-containing protein n=1 Tax=Myxococcus dinghuensis TaxID=2906761 RepID=UPI0020A836A9|nr:AgmX/PglI C-terminal domain-containing protein [Myxococcus dinghuensis]MCP3098318.1 AgmX/PglI C-terminal domain-containing protein [Myxococcus dinghuensis]
MGELLSGDEGRFRTRGVGTPGATHAHADAEPLGLDEPMSVTEALDEDLDAYLDRELRIEPREEDVTPDGDDSSREPSAGMRALLELAEEETRWLGGLPAPGGMEPPDATSPVVLPAWMRANPRLRIAMPVRAPWAHPVDDVASERESRGDAAGAFDHGADARPGLNLQQQPWGLRMGPPMPLAPEVSRARPQRRFDLMSGMLLGVAAVGVVAAVILGVLSLRILKYGGPVARTGFSGADLHGVPGGGGEARSPVGPTAGLGQELAPVNGTSSGQVTSPGGEPASPRGVVPSPGASTQAMSSGAGLASTPGAPPSQAQPAHVGTGLSSPPGASTPPSLAVSRGSLLPLAGGVSVPGAEVRGAANGLHAGGTATGGTQLPRAVSGTPGAELMARRDTLAVKNAPRRARDVSEPSAAPPAATPAAPPAVQELSFDSGEASDDDTASVATEAVEAAVETGPDEEFARELGFTEEADAARAEEAAPTRTVYVPPALDGKASLTPDDVRQVVVAHQPAITACIRRHAQDTKGEEGGRFTVRWSVLPSGETTDVAMDTASLRSTPLAGCIEGVVRGWKFPEHHVRMSEPIRFPFVF